MAQTCRLFIELGSHHGHIVAVHDGLIVLVYEVGLLTLELVILLKELEQLVIERGTAHLLLGIVYLDMDIATLQHDGHHALVVHEDVGHTHGVYTAGKPELSMHHIARVKILKLVIGEHFQIQFASIERRDIGSPLDIKRTCTRRKCQQGDKGI